MLTDVTRIRPIVSTLSLVVRPMERRIIELASVEHLPCALYQIAGYIRLSCPALLILIAWVSLRCNHHRIGQAPEHVDPVPHTCIALCVSRQGSQSQRAHERQLRYAGQHAHRIALGW